MYHHSNDFVFVFLIPQPSNSLSFQTYIEFFPKLGETNVAALIIAAISILILAVFKEHIQPRFKKKFKVPFPIELIVVSTLNILVPKRTWRG